ncbi:hypothetical protein MGG_13679 [Pyricularia oryzae 70-15]|uniref:Uncharacterized protein n=1 Tax=Pyricularia oryzae (strain 70-15 / ATCC MYA-4617 / FGSC 8958) TaxID=242507 RepID=G4MMS3_PYRO7|nr:uncharacterized protein MGG_13679 [Pyricularia oryzae 70-15]EHA56153.1 hypothetical protein MGG_13679 [Pyricularia oryzae 70-15]
MSAYGHNVLGPEQGSEEFSEGRVVQVPGLEQNCLGRWRRHISRAKPQRVDLHAIRRAVSLFWTGPSGSVFIVP